jgi:long-chain acyl-CoA synthetase
MDVYFKLKKRTIGDLFIFRTEKSKRHNAIGWIDDDQINFINYEQYRFQVESLALAFKKQGIKRQDKICIFANTCKEWNYFDLALLSSGVIVVPIYHTYTESDISYIINHSEATSIIVDNEEQFSKLLSVVHECKNLTQIIAIEPISNKLKESIPKNIFFFDYKDFFITGKEELDHNPDLFKRLIDETAEGDIASIIYTSGTTGDPKGAVITQKAITQMLLNVKKFTHNAFSTTDRTLTFLPLSHVFGRCDSFYH